MVLVGTVPYTRTATNPSFINELGFMSRCNSPPATKSRMLIFNYTYKGCTDVATGLNERKRTRKKAKPFDADPDPADLTFHLDGDPDPADLTFLFGVNPGPGLTFHFYVNPGPGMTFHFDMDPDPSDLTFHLDGEWGSGSC